MCLNYSGSAKTEQEFRSFQASDVPSLPHTRHTQSQGNKLGCAVTGGDTESWVTRTAEAPLRLPYGQYRKTPNHGNF